jgi:hypothetical protein
LPLIQAETTVEQRMIVFLAIFTFLIAIYSLWKILALTNHLFSGSAGAECTVCVEDASNILQ